MEIKVKLDIKDIRKAFALIDEEIPSDDEIIKNMEDMVFDISKIEDEDTKRNLSLGLAVLAIGQAFSD